MPTVQLPTNSHTPTIGVFDSGFGGLTVLRALVERIPQARYALCNARTAGAVLPASRQSPTP